MPDLISTSDVLRLLREANPAKTVTEDAIRRALRSGEIEYPQRIGLILAWSDEDIFQLAHLLDIEAPEPRS